MAKNKETLFKQKVQRDIKRELPEAWVLKTQERSIRGIPDLLICVRKRFAALELKTDEGSATGLQEWVLSKIRLAGGFAEIVTPTNWPNVLARLKNLGNKGDNAYYMEVNMIKLTWGEIRDSRFLGAAHKIKTLPLPFKLSYHISRILSKVDSELKVSTEEYTKIVKRHGDLDEVTGNFKIKEELAESWKKEVEEFLKHSFDIDKRKILVAELPQDVKLSPEDISVLDFLFSDLEALEGGKSEESSQKN